MRTMNTLIDLGLQLARSESEGEFRQAIESATDFMGASIYNAMAFDSDENGTHGIGLDNFPIVYDPGDMGPTPEKRDPVVEHCRVHASPIFWGQSNYVEANCASMWEHIASYGLRQGAGLALHIGKHRHFCLGFIWDRRKPLSQKEQAKAMRTLQALAIFSEQTAFRLWHPDARPQMSDVEHPLSPRERECLYWVSRGMTDEVIAGLMNISARTVRKHVDNSVANCRLRTAQRRLSLPRSVAF